MPRTCVALAVLAFLGLSVPGIAELCTIDAVPAATLLLPYFGVSITDLDGKRSEVTEFSINNTSPAPTVAHVTLWTDMSIPTLRFNVVLTGYDVQVVSLNDIFSGKVPGQLGPSCEDLGSDIQTQLTAQEADDLQRQHIGTAVDGLCYSQVHRDKIARGYVTIDNASDCTDLTPADSGYFGSDSVVRSANQLWGEYSVVNRKRRYAESEALVSIEAEPGRFSAGDYTFYGRFVGFDGSDQLEPVGTTWSARYRAIKRRTLTHAVVWRDSGTVQEPFSCSSIDDIGWYPLDYRQIIVFNEEEDEHEVFEASFPAETQQVRIGHNDLFPVPFRAGWAFLDFGLQDFDLQSHVTLRHKYGKNYLRSRTAAELYFDPSGGGRRFGNPAFLALNLRTGAATQWRCPEVATGLTYAASMLITGGRGLQLTDGNWRQIVYPPARQGDRRPEMQRKSAHAIRSDSFVIRKHPASRYSKSPL